MFAIGGTFLENEATLFSPTSEWCLPSPFKKKKGTEFVVDSGD